MQEIRSLDTGAAELKLALSKRREP